MRLVLADDGVERWTGRRELGAAREGTSGLPVVGHFESLSTELQRVLNGQIINIWRAIELVVRWSGAADGESCDLLSTSLMG